MVNKILFWSGFGLAVRFWQLGIEMRPFHHQLWAYGIYGGLGASFGYWMQSVEDKQMRYLRETRDRLLEKRRRRAEREEKVLGDVMPRGEKTVDLRPIGLNEVSGEDIAVAEGRKLAGRA